MKIIDHELLELGKTRGRLLNHMQSRDKYYSSHVLNESKGTPFCYVTAFQGLQEALGLHLLVPGAGGVGAGSHPIK